MQADLDDISRRMLRRMQSDPDLTATALAEDIGIPVATCYKRLERLRDQGILRGVQSVMNWPALGYSVEVSLRITLEKSNPRAFDEFQAAARLVPEVIAIQTFLGRVDVRLSIVARDMPDYQRLYRDSILTLPHLSEVEALMHVATLKTAEVLPI